LAAAPAVRAFKAAVIKGDSLSAPEQEILRIGDARQAIKRGDVAASPGYGVEPD
jgi:hypothetical protein